LTATRPMNGTAPEVEATRRFSRTGNFNETPGVGTGGSRDWFPFGRRTRRPRRPLRLR
jgi:hypothetical protein